MIRLTIPSVRYEEVEEGLREVLATGWLTGGPKQKEFEDLTAAFLGAKHAIACSNGTTALHLALLAVGVGPGDEVVCSDYTFPATANSVEYCGAQAVLCDVELGTYNMSAQDLEKRITSKTKAIMPVHQFGLSADMDPIIQLANKHGLMVIEDAACAIGAKYDGHMVGTFGDAATFSYHPRKVITTGEGGMVITGNDEIAEAVQSLRNHGMRDVDGHKTFADLGYNYRLSEVHAVLGVAQTKKLEWINGERRRLAAMLNKLLAGTDGLYVPEEPEGCEHIYQSYVVRLEDGIDRDGFVNGLRDGGVEATTGAAACHTLKYYQDKYEYKDGDLPGSFTLFNQTATLPLYPGMEEGDVKTVAETVKKVLGEL